MLIIITFLTGIEAALNTYIIMAGFWLEIVAKG
jgi:hypothetical protein